jgi:hypothetical protein
MSKNKENEMKSTYMYLFVDGIYRIYQFINDRYVKIGSCKIEDEALAWVKRLSS